MTNQFFADTLNMIVTSSIAEIFSIFAAALPSGKSWSFRMRLFFSSIPLISNVLLLVLISFVEYQKPSRIKITIQDFIALPDYQRTIVFGIIMSFLLGVFIFVVLFLARRDKYTDRRLAKHYIKMTERQLPNGEMTLIGGTLDFLGNCPCENEQLEGNKCTKKHLSVKCKKCCWSNKQWVQIHDLLKNGCTIKIVCINPEELERRRNVEQLLGILLKVENSKKWQDKSRHLIIKFYPSKNDPIIRGRIIQQINSKEKQCCWNFITQKKGIFSEPHIYDQSNLMGNFIIDSLERIFASTDSISVEVESKLINGCKNDRSTDN